ncbi:MAG: ABC transporter permease subunit [Holosporales bacterium]|jgi:putrescine transport system permease protein|nr:ABC transporter permease subunit [Holosporales bacterium]
MSSLSRTTFASLIFGFSFLYLPLIFTAIFAFSDAELAGVWTHFSLKWFKAILNDEDLLIATFTSIRIAGISATVSIILGTLAAAATMNTPRGKYDGYNFLKRIILLPIMIPEIITGFSILMLFMVIESMFGWPKERGILVVAAGHSVASVAYVYATVSSSLASLDQSMGESAINLGAKPIHVFFHITVPLSWRAIVSGWFLAFILSFDDLVIASFLTGPGTSTLPIVIFSNIRVGVTPTINAFVTVFVVITIILASIVYFRTLCLKGRRKGRSATR